MSLSIDDLSRYEREATRFYVGWFVIYVALGVGAIVFPGLAAMGVTFGVSDGTKYLAGLGALFAAIYGFLRPNDYIAAFDSAIAELRSIRVRFDLMTAEQRADRLEACLRLMAFKYPAAIPANTKPSVPV